MGQESLADEDEGSPLQNGVNRLTPGKSRDQRMPSKPNRFALSFQNFIINERVMDNQ